MLALVMNSIGSRAMVMTVSQLPFRQLPTLTSFQSVPTFSFATTRHRFMLRLIRSRSPTFSMASSLLRPSSRTGLSFSTAIAIGEVNPFRLMSSPRATRSLSPSVGKRSAAGWMGMESRQFAISRPPSAAPIPSQS